MSLNNPIAVAARENGGNLSENSSENDSSSAGHTSSDDDDDENAEDGHPMMSIFASYYGIADPSAAPEVDLQPKGTIDDAGFQPEAYVKVRRKDTRKFGLCKTDSIKWSLKQIGFTDYRLSFCYASSNTESAIERTI